MDMQALLLQTVAMHPNRHEPLREQLTLRLTTAEREHLEALAASQDRSLGWLVRDGLKRLLAEPREVVITRGDETAAA